MQRALPGLAAAIFLLAAPALRADQSLADKYFASIMAAQAARDYDAFVANGTTELKNSLEKENFAKASETLARRLSGGYDIKPLGELRQRGCDVYLYRIRLKNHSDDILAILSLREDKVAGIYFR